MDYDLPTYSSSSRATVKTISPRPPASAPSSGSSGSGSSNGGSNTGFYIGLLIMLCLLGLALWLAWYFCPSSSSGSSTGSKSGQVGVPVSIAGSWLGFNNQGIKLGYDWKINQKSNVIDVVDNNMPTTKSAGSVVNNTVTIPGFNLSGSVAADGKRINWSDGSYWQMS